ncbi:hypothetical protein ACWEPL_16580 [Nonomuraea sp. NPDC004186]
MKKWVPTAALAAALLAGLTPPASAASPTDNEVHNTGTVWVGAIQVRNFNTNLAYRSGKYDELIPAGLFSGYRHTDGIYIGPGYCGRFRQWLRGTEQNPPAPEDLADPQVIRGERWVWFPEPTIGWDVRALPLSDPLCAGASLTAKDGKLLIQPEQSR